MAAAFAALVLGPTAASAQAGCERAVLFTLPATTWDDVAQSGHDAFTDLRNDGSVGSVSVRTNTSRTSHASGFASIGGGTRLDATQSAAQPLADPAGDGATLPNLGAVRDLAAKAGYSTARPGALGSALRAAGIDVTAVGNSDLGAEPPSPVGLSRPALLAATDESGRVAPSYTGTLSEAAAAPFGVMTDLEATLEAIDAGLDGCGLVVVDPGDLVRADVASFVAGGALDIPRAAALDAAATLLQSVRARLDPERDLLLVVAPSSPTWDPDVHFGVAAAVGPGFPAGGTLQSPSTRRSGIVTLPDVAPTVLEHFDVERPASMLGRAWTAGVVERDPVAAALELDDESVFMDRLRTPVSTVFVIAQVLLYAVTVWVLTRRGSRLQRSGRTVLQALALGLAAFPLAGFLAGLVDGHEIGALAYGFLLLALAAAVVVAAMAARRDPLDRLLIVVGASWLVLIADLVVGAPLQLNTVFSYSPIVAGRFAGIGNIGFAILTATALLTGTLVVHRWGRTRRTLTAVAILFAVTVVVDGAPQWGSDVGGAIALVPGLGLAWLLLAGQRPRAKSVLVAALAGVVVLAAFLAVDLARPEAERTHLARLFEDVRSGGGTVFADTIERKVRTNLRVFRSTIWTFVVPPALAVLAWLLFFPRGRWERLRASRPTIVSGLLAGALLAALGFAVNDSGIVIPAMMCAYLVPIGLLTHMSLDDALATDGT